MNNSRVSRQDDQDQSLDLERLLASEEDSGDKRQTYRIGDLAAEFGISLRALRFYEDRGLIAPERRGTTRIYSRRDRKRLRLVLLAKLLGFSLTEARQMIELYDGPSGERRQLETALARLEDQREVLIEQRRELDEATRAMEISLEFVRRRLSES